MVSSGITVSFPPDAPLDRSAQGFVFDTVAVWVNAINGGRSLAVGIEVDRGDGAS